VLVIGSLAFSASMAVYEERQRRQEERAPLVEEIERRLVTAHWTEFPPCQRPRRVEPVLKSSKERRRELERESLELNRSADRATRRALRRGAHERAYREVAEENARRLSAADADDEQALDWWERLNRCDELTVLQTLEQAFADNEMPAVAVGCANRGVAVVMIAPDAKTLPDETVLRRRGRRLKIKKRSSVDRHSLHTLSLASSLLATVKETFAVAPGVAFVDVLAVVRTDPALRRRDRLVPVCLVRIDRATVRGLKWKRTDPLGFLQSQQHVVLDLAPETGALRPIDLDSEPDAEGVLASVADGLGCLC
jgi:hypothetical protein